MLDPSLRGLVEAKDEAEAERWLAALLQVQAAPLVRKIVARKRGAGGPESASEDIEDIVADTLLALLARLQSLRADPASHSIESFADYTAVVAHNAFAQYLRRRYPRRSRLKQQLRYVFTREGRFALWQTPDGLACGLAAWRPARAHPSASEKLDRVIADPERWLRWTRRGRMSPSDLAALLGAIFQAIDGPVELDRLVGAIGPLVPEPMESDLVSPGPDHPAADVALDQRRMMERLWLEIGARPVRQRVALLLSLRDAGGGSLLWVFPLTGAASIRQIAGVLAIPDLELATLWNRLPLDDLSIAARLGATRQQVINLRGAARKRLANRLDQDGGRVPANTRAISASLEDEA
jgi:DNA-directed RNA polymerase specialized sigma24 family protein